MRFHKVDSNGNINIGKINTPMGLATPGFFSPTPITNSTMRNWAGISVAHEDLHPTIRGSIMTSGTAADGAFIISWQGVNFYGSAGGILSAQAVLYPDGGVEVRWGAANMNG